MAFQGFRAESFQFFRELTLNNHRLWFESQREVYEEFVLTPFAELEQELAPSMLELNQNFTPGETAEEHLSRIELTGELPAEGPHYKTSLYQFWWNTEIPRLCDGHLHIGIGADAVTLGFSIYDWSYDKGRMREVFKPRLRGHLSLLDDYIKANYLRRGFEFRRFVRGAGRLGLREGEAFPNRGAQWQDTLGWVVSRQIHENSSRLTPGSFVSECKNTFERLYPLYVFSSDMRSDWRDVLKV